jgi:hypothetical protein
MEGYFSPMYSNVQAEQFDECHVISKPEKRSKVLGVIFGRVNGRKLALTKYIPIDAACNVWKFCNTAATSYE